MNTKHTPLPWVKHETGFSIYTDQTNRAGMYSVCQGFQGNPMEMNAANMEFISRACNSHYELLQIAKDIRMYRNNPKIMNKIIDQIDEAIKKAEASNG